MRNTQPRFRMQTIPDIREVMTLEEVCNHMKSAHEMGYRKGFRAALDAMRKPGGPVIGDEK
jgi:hypothetical protein